MGFAGHIAWRRLFPQQRAHHMPASCAPLHQHWHKAWCGGAHRRRCESIPWASLRPTSRPTSTAIARPSASCHFPSPSSVPHRAHNRTRYGSPHPAALAAAAALGGGWYSNRAATGSTPSLYQDDLLVGPLSALAPDALPPADGACGRGGGGGGAAQYDGGRGGWVAGACNTSPLKAHAHAGRNHANGYGQQQHHHQQQHQHQQQQDAAAAAEQQWRNQQREQQDVASQAEPQSHHHHQPQPVPMHAKGGGGSGSSDMGSRSSAGTAPQADAPASVLGTWAQRLFRLPLPGRGSQKQLQQQESNGRSAANSGRQDCDPASSVAQPIPGAAPWPAPHKHAAATNVVAVAADAKQPAAAAAAGVQQQQQQQHEQAQQRQRQRGQERARPAGASEDEDDEEVIARAAWRWRFAKRWQAEQARQLDPAASGGDGDGLEDTLAYLTACGQPWAELSRTMSDGLGRSGSGGGQPLLGTVDSVGLLGQERLLVGESGSRAPSLGNGSPFGGGLLRRSSTPLRGPSILGGAGGGAGAGGAGGGRGGGGSGRGGGAATRELNAVTRRANALLATQSGLDRAADERWREAQAPPGGELWVGALLEAVEIDDWGKFKFVLVRVRDRGGRQKLLIRGGNYASEGALVEALHRQVRGRLVGGVFWSGVLG